MTTIAFHNTPAPRLAAPRLRPPRLRLTSRGRTVIGTLVAIPLVAFAILVGPSVVGAQAGDDAVVNSFQYVSVEPGQSLWQLAEQVAPQADPREVIADFLTLNNLSSADVQPGQQLAIPAQYAE